MRPLQSNILAVHAVAPGRQVIHCPPGHRVGIANSGDREVEVVLYGFGPGEYTRDGEGMGNIVPVWMDDETAKELGGAAKVEAEIRAYLAEAEAKELAALKAADEAFNAKVTAMMASAAKAFGEATAFGVGGTPAVASAGSMVSALGGEVSAGHMNAVPFATHVHSHSVEPVKPINVTAVKKRPIRFEP